MDALVQFMNGPLGRVARVVLGLVLIAYGLMVLGGTAGYVVAAFGLVPIALGAAGRCMVEFIAPKH